jgi:protein-S-isoprenylcysteine O-methyltransferase Ste14
MGLPRLRRMTPYGAHARVAAILFGVTAGLWLVGELRQAFRTRPEAVTADRHSLAVVRLFLLAGWLIAATSRSFAPGARIGGGAPVFALGLVVAWIGIGLRWWAFRSLGRFFTINVMTSDDQPVIDSGPYRFLRHPSYAGLVVALVGGGVMYGNWVGVAALAVVPTVGLVLRIRVEERALAAALGDAYLEFAGRRSRMIPHIW